MTKQEILDNYEYKYRYDSLYYGEGYIYSVGKNQYFISDNEDIEVFSYCSLTSILSPAELK